MTRPPASGAPACVAPPPALARVLRGAPRHTWASFAILVDGETVKLMPRVDLSRFLREADLADLADEAIARRVPIGGVLVFDVARGRLHVLGGERRTPGVPAGRVSPARSSSHRRSAPSRGKQTR